MNSAFNAKLHLQEMLQFLKSFCRHPVERMKRPPYWEPRKVFAFQFLLAAASGLIAGILSRSALSVLWGILVFPVLTVIANLIATIVVFYGLIFIFDRKVDGARLYHILVLANIPFAILRIFSTFFPPLDILGFFVTGLLLIVGLVENFRIPRKPLLRWIGGVTILILCIWLFYQGRNKDSTSHRSPLATPETLDLLDREFQE